MNKEEDMPANLYARALNEVGYGDLAHTASEELAKVVKSVRETGKKGSLTVTLEIKPRGRDSGQVELSGDVKAKTPIAPIAPSMLFATEDGNLLRDNPLQGKLPFGEPSFVKTAAN